MRGRYIYNIYIEFYLVSLQGLINRKQKKSTFYRFNFFKMRLYMNIEEKERTKKNMFTKTSQKFNE